MILKKVLINSFISAARWHNKWKKFEVDLRSKICKILSKDSILKPLQKG